MIALISPHLMGCNVNAIDSQILFPNFNDTIGIEGFPKNLKLESSISVYQIDGGLTIDLVITNDCDCSIQFTPGYGSKIFAYDGITKDWVEVQNLINYVGDGDILGSKSEGSENWTGFFTIAPDLPDFHTFEILRIAVVGTVFSPSDSESSKVGTFIDIQLNSN